MTRGKVGSSRAFDIELKSRLRVQVQNYHMNLYRVKEKTDNTSLFPNVQRYSHIFGKLSPLSIMLETVGMQVFFVVDTCYCKTESDDLKDAIFFYYPPQIPENQACSLCGQLFGAVQFSSSLFSLPKLIRLARGKFAVKKWNKYLFLLGGLSESPDLKLLQGLDSLCRVFCFYHKNIDVILEVKKHNMTDFHLEMRNIWTFFLKSVRHDHSRLGSIPGALYRVPNLSPALISKAIYLLKSCQKYSSIIAGCITHKRQLVATQLPSSVTFFLCNYRASDQVEENFTGPPLSDGFINIKVYLRKSELKNLNDLNPTIKDLKRKKENLAIFTNDSNVSEGAESSQIISGSSEELSQDDKISLDSPDFFHSDSGRLSLNEEKILERPELTHSSLKETLKLDIEKSILKKKSNSLLICNLAQESLKKMEEDKRQLKRRGRKKKSISKSNQIEDITSPTDDADIKISENSNGFKPSSFSSLSPFWKERIDSSDSSVFEANSWVTEDSRKELKLSAKSPNTGASSQTEFLSSVELGVQSPSYAGKSCPLFLGQSSDENSPSQSIGSLPNQNLNKESQDVDNVSLNEDNDSYIHKSECNYDEDVVELDLLSITHSNTTLFLLSDDFSIDLRESLNEVSFLALKQLDLEIGESAFALEKSKTTNSSNISSIYLDTILNTVTGNKYSKAYNLMEDFTQYSKAGIKSLTTMNINGVAYAHSSMTHDIYIQNTTKQCTPGIPSSQDPIARISGLTKQDQDKMGYYLLK